VSLLRDKKISMDDARNATTDRIGFADACYTALLDAA
jgi:twitching motility protein PilT